MIDITFTPDMDDIVEMIELAAERFESCCDDIIGRRFRSATADIYYGTESLCRAMLFAVGVAPQTHQGIHRMFSMHFIKSGVFPKSASNILPNLYDRRKTAEYSVRAGWEFDLENVKTYVEWAMQICPGAVKWLEENVFSPNDASPGRAALQRVVNALDKVQRAAVAPRRQWGPPKGRAP